MILISCSEYTGGFLLITKTSENAQSFSTSPHPTVLYSSHGDSNITEWTKLKKRKKKTHCFINQTILLSLVITVYIHNTIVTIKNIIFKVKPCICYFSWSKKKNCHCFSELGISSLFLFFFWDTTKDRVSFSCGSAALLQVNHIHCLVTD